MKMDKHWKKALASLLTVALVMCSVQWSDGGASTVLAEDVNFGEAVLKLGVLSDVHLAYGYDTSASIQRKTQQYVKAVATLDRMAGEDGLDAVLLSGDYTGYGCYEQAKTFTTASAAIMKYINEGREDKTQFFMTYGNHDTEWPGQADYETWEALFHGDKVAPANKVVDINVVDATFANGTIENVVLGDSLNYTATVKITEDKTTDLENNQPGYGGIRLTIGQGTYNDTTGYLELAIRPNVNDVVFFLHGGNHEGEQVILHVPNCATELNQNIACDVQYENGKLSFWMNGECVIDALDLAEQGITNVTLEPGYCAQECVGTISDIEIWDDADDLFENVVAATDENGNELVNSGSYKWTKQVEDKTYTFLSVETEGYARNGSNVFRNDVLAWLDRELAEATESNPNAYVYIVSHGPIKETGVYGSDIEYDKNANWGTAKDGVVTDLTIDRDFGNDKTSHVVSSSINKVLEKYPQVVYFSGHTHWTNRLESSIMADAYTAINVASVQVEGYFSEVSEYLDGYKNSAYGTSIDMDTSHRDGYALYIEVDADGNQRIQRVNITDSEIVTGVTLNGTGYDKSENIIPNPNENDSKTYPYISAFYTDSVEIEYDENASVVTYEDAWVMAAPKTDKSHLTPFTAEARNAEAGVPKFADGATVTISNVKTTDQLAFDFTFPTATVENGHKIIRYDLTVKDQDGKVLGTNWILGNWIANTEGCVPGETHLTAKELTYTKAFSRDEVKDVTGFSVSITAWNEFGGSTTISSDEVQNIEIITKPPVGAYYENLFDDLTLDDMVIATNGDGKYENVYSEVIDAKGNVEITYNTLDKVSGETCTSYHDEFIYVLNNEYSSADFGSWGKVGRHASKATSIDPSDTFVYATDFNITNGSNAIYFTFRSPEASAGHSHMDYAGVVIQAASVVLALGRNDLTDANGDKYQVNTDYSDGNTHTLVVLSTPTNVTVWIDDKIIFDNVEYDVSKLCTGTGTTEDPYILTNPTVNNTTVLPATLKSTTMYPVIAIYSSGKAEFTVNNQFLHVYNPEEDLSTEFGATDKNYYDKESVTGADATTINSFTVNELELGTTKAVSMNLGTKFKVTDEVIMEFDITPGEFTPGTSTAKTKIIGFKMKYRKDSALSSNNYATLTERYTQDGGYQEIYNHFRDSYMTWGTGKGKFTANTTYHYKIVADNEKVSIWVNDVAVATEARYDATNNGTDSPNVSSTTMIPTFEFEFTSSSWKVTNIEIRKADGSGTLDNVTQLTDENNLMNKYGEITSSFKGNSAWEGKSDSTVNGTNFYTDLTYMNFDINGATGYFMGENFTLFGVNNSNYTLASNESFVMSALVKVSNTKLTNTAGTTLNNRVGAEFATYDKIRPWYFIESVTSNGVETTKLYVYHTDDFNGNILAATINLSTLMGYERSVYNRITNVVSPFGYDIYINGYKVFGEEIGNGSNVTYNNVKFTANGVEATFVDVSVCYNKENAELYEDKIQEAVRNYEQTMQGIYGTQKADYDAHVSEMKANCETANGDYDTLKAYASYVGTIEEYKNELLGAGRVVNNNIQQEITTAYGKNTYVNAKNGTNWTNVHLPIFDGGECPFNENSMWVIEADISVNESNFVENQAMRIGLSLLGDAEGTVFVQSSDRFYRKATDNSFVWSENLSGASGTTLKQTGTWHVKFAITEDESLQMTVISSDGTTVLQDFTVDLAEAGYDFTGKDLYPRLYFSCGVYNVSNLEVYSLENVEHMTATIRTEEIVEAPNTGWNHKNLYIYGDASVAPDLQDGDVWILEADLKASDACSRIGFSLNTSEGHVMVQGKTMYYNAINEVNPGEASPSGWEAGNLGHAECGFTAGNWHVKYTVAWGSKIVTELTNEAGNVITYEAPWDNINNLPDTTVFNPSIYFVNTVAELSNIYVGYDLTSDVAELNTANDNATAKAKEDNVTSVSIQNIEAAQQVAAPVIATTAAYTKAEINAATDALNDAIKNAKQGRAIGVSTEEEGTAKLIATEGEPVYIGYIDETYGNKDIEGQIYIAGWTDAEGNPVDTWSESAKPQVIDTKMLYVKYQGEHAKDSTSKYRVRFLSSVNDTEGYKRAGLVFSFSDSNQNPDINNGIVRDTTSVYKSVIAAGQQVTVEETYDDYSTYMYGRIINNIPDGQKAYVRGFVELDDGRIIYGKTRAITVDSSMLSAAEQ